MKYIVDSMLGRLAVWLRILGYDATFYQENNDGGNLLLTALKEQRIIITRDTHLLKKLGQKMIFIKSDFIREQVKQLLTEYPNEFTVATARLFSRCTLCNSPVEPITKELVKGRVPPFVYETSHEFSQCPVCQKIYWRGTHWERLLHELEKMK